MLIFCSLSANFSLLAFLFVFCLLPVCFLFAFCLLLLISLLSYFSLFAFLCASFHLSAFCLIIFAFCFHFLFASWLLSVLLCLLFFDFFLLPVCFLFAFCLFLFAFCLPPVCFLFSFYFFPSSFLSSLPVFASCLCFLLLSVAFCFIPLRRLQPFYREAKPMWRFRLWLHFFWKFRCVFPVFPFSPCSSWPLLQVNPPPAP